MIVSARQWGGFAWKNLKLVSGRLPNDGRRARTSSWAQRPLKCWGKKSAIPPTRNEELAVVGIVDGSAVVENGSIILSLPLLQEITGNEGKNQYY